MKQKSENNKKNSAEKYFSPNVKVITISIRQGVCQAGSVLSGYEQGNGLTGGNDFDD